MAHTPRVLLTELAAGERLLEGDAAHYLSRVQRLRAGDGFVAFDPATCLESVATVLELGRRGVSCRLESPRPGQRSRLDARLLQCIGKGDKVDEVVRAATALGVSGVTLCVSARTVVAVGDRAGARLQRLQQIALSVAAQCGRGDLPELAGPAELAQVLADERTADALKICLQPRAAKSYGALLEQSAGRRVVLLVGPEGGFDAQELELATEAGFEQAAFGDFELRTELCGVAALGALVAVRGR